MSFGDMSRQSGVDPERGFSMFGGRSSVARLESSSTTVAEELAECCDRLRSLANFIDSLELFEWRLEENDGNTERRVAGMGRSTLAPTEAFSLLTHMYRAHDYFAVLARIVSYDLMPTDLASTGKSKRSRKRFVRSRGRVLASAHRTTSRLYEFRDNLSALSVPEDG